MAGLRQSLTATVLRPSLCEKSETLTTMTRSITRPTLSRRRAANVSRIQEDSRERAFAQTSDEDFFRTIDDESNSIAVIVKHMAGNMLSRWTDFLTTDGEKPDRNRDMEFVMLPETTKDDMLAFWEKGWKCIFAAIEPLTRRRSHADGEDSRPGSHSVQAINRQIAHYANHVGQIVYLAKHFKASEWQTLSVPKNKSAEVNVAAVRIRTPPACSRRIISTPAACVTGK